MNRNNIVLFVLVLFLLVFQGCASIYSSSYSPPVLHMSNIMLKENDFKVVKRNITGQHSCRYVFLVPLDDPRLFSNALANLYSKVQNETEGKSTQLINWTKDDYTSQGCLFFYYRRTIKFRADLIEFKK